MKSTLRAFECPECGGKFSTWLEKSAPPPDYCHLCKADMGEPIVLTGKVKFLANNPSQGPMPTRVNIGTAAGKSPDLVFRQMESASIQRAQEAADHLGVSVAEVSDIKITNMRDNPKEGESSAMTPTPSAPAAILPPVSASDGQYFASRAKAQGKVKTQTDTQNWVRGGHKQREGIVARNGRMGSFAG